jgi:hypothetical protein
MPSNPKPNKRNVWRLIRCLAGRVTLVERTTATEYEYCGPCATGMCRIADHQELNYPFLWLSCGKSTEGQGAKGAREGPVTYDKLEQGRARVKCH